MVGLDRRAVWPFAKQIPTVQATVARRLVSFSDASSARVKVLDDGERFPDGFDLSHSANTGLELAAALTKTDLDGKLEFGNRP